MDVSKNKGKTPKTDGENNGKPIKMDDLVVPLFLETPMYTGYKPSYPLIRPFIGVITLLITGRRHQLTTEI